MSKTSQLWGSKTVEKNNSLVEENTWCETHNYQAPFLSFFTFKAGNKDYALAGFSEAGTDQQAKLRISELALKKKYR